MIRSRRLVRAAVGGAMALACTVLTAPAQAAPAVDEPAGTVRLVTEKRVTVDYPWAGASASSTARAPPRSPRSTTPARSRPPTPARTTWPPAPTS
ncbi:hypothetical protein ACFV20_19905 [Streptomyces sp. NPDC059696]|uniref:hypothetical protein n=1 Tax=Streptomyces sp. NPDC059696 TaxID=3346911 RepID=UPI003697360B